MFVLVLYLLLGGLGVADEGTVTCTFFVASLELILAGSEI